LPQRIRAHQIRNYLLRSHTWVTQFTTTWPGVKCPSAMFPAVYSSKRGSYDISDRSNGRQYIIFHIARCTLKCCYTVSLHRRTKINKSPACYVRRRYMAQSRDGDLNAPRTCRHRRIDNTAFSVAASQAWNRLSTELKQLRSTASFRQNSRLICPAWLTELRTQLFNFVIVAVTVVCSAPALRSYVQLWVVLYRRLLISSSVVRGTVARGKFQPTARCTSEMMQDKATVTTER